MYIKELSLMGFRNLEKTTIELNKDINILYGQNAQGKTNLLESIYLCATGRSQRTKTESYLIKFGEKESHIQVFVVKKNKIDKIDIHLKKDSKKGVAINSIIIKKLGELLGTLYVVIFSPEDLNLIKNGPSEKRRFLDIEICQVNRLYYYNLQQYYKTLKQRNYLLKTIQNNKELENTVFIWDKQLIKYGKQIITQRAEFIKSLNEIASKKHFEITGNSEELSIEYKPNVMQEIFEKRLVEYRQRDFITKITAVGPHKDDLQFLINKNDVKIYGSQGQQRTAALSTKLAEIEFIYKETGEFPVLLLDDVFSELDESRQNYLLQNMKNIQVILTCTEIEHIVKEYNQKYSLYHVNNGKIAIQKNEN